MHSVFLIYASSLSLLKTIENYLEISVVNTFFIIAINKLDVITLTKQKEKLLQSHQI